MYSFGSDSSVWTGKGSEWVFFRLLFEGLKKRYILSLDFCFQLKIQTTYDSVKLRKCYNIQLSYPHCKRKISVYSRELAVSKVSFGGGPAWWGDDSMRTMEEGGRQQSHQQTWEGAGERKKNETIENQGKSERPPCQASFHATGKFNGSYEKGKRSMGSWGCLAVGLYFHPLLGRGSTRDAAELVVLELLCPASPGGAQTLPPHPFTHFSRKSQKRGKPTDLLAILHFSHCVVIVYMPMSLTCS